MIIRVTLLCVQASIPSNIRLLGILDQKKLLPKEKVSDVLKEHCSEVILNEEIGDKKGERHYQVYIKGKKYCTNKSS